MTSFDERKNVLCMCLGLNNFLIYLLSIYHLICISCYTCLRSPYVGLLKGQNLARELGLHVQVCNVFFCMFNESVFARLSYIYRILKRSRNFIWRMFKKSLCWSVKRPKPFKGWKFNSIQGFKICWSSNALTLTFFPLFAT